MSSVVRYRFSKYDLPLQRQTFLWYVLLPFAASLGCDPSAYHQEPSDEI
jgi:hypothetical protein